MALKSPKVATALRRIKEAERTHAEELDLSRLRLREIPQEVARLPWLKRLYLGLGKRDPDAPFRPDTNHFALLDDGRRNWVRLPKGLAAALPELEILDLTHCGMSSLPAEIGLFRNLQELFLTDNQLDELPKEFGRLTSLRRLDLNRNNRFRYTGIPAVIGELQALEWLSLDYCDITRLPKEIGCLKQLRYLSVVGFYISDLPARIGNLTSLEELHMRTDGVPKEFGRLSNLKRLGLSLSGSFSGFPHEFSQLHSLEELSIGGGELICAPQEIFQLEKLKKLFISGHAHFELPAEIGNLTALEEFNLAQAAGPDSQPLTCSLPPEMSKLTSLKKLGLRGFNITPSGIDTLPALEELHCDLKAPAVSKSAQNPQSAHSGTVLKVGPWPSLRKLRTTANGLSAGIDLLANLEELILEDFSEALPSEISGLTSLKKLHAHGLEYLPPAIGSLSSLEELILHFGRFESIPIEIGNLINLKILDISYNRRKYYHDTTLVFPSEIKKLKSLEVLRIDNSIILPREIGLLHSLKELDIHSDDRFSPPLEIWNLRNVHTLKIYSQCSSSSFPIAQELGAMQSLKHLTLATKSIQLPASIGALKALETLNLSDTDLINLPPEIGELSSLVELRMLGKIDRLPSSLCKLTRLEKLEIVPNNIGNNHEFEYKSSYRGNVSAQLSKLFKIGLPSKASKKSKQSPQKDQ